MDRSGTVLLGALATVAFSLTGYVLLPAVGAETVAVTRADGSPYPVALTPEESAGRDAYRDLGCVYCHSQQVRAEAFGADIARGWGRRGSIPLDYVGQTPPLLGTMRTGPDLADVGSRQPSEAWHYLHLYDPQITSPGSNMPPFPFLFEEVSGEPPERLALPATHARAGVSVVPGPRAKALVAYLRALKQDPTATAEAR
jgi:cytochrome c oxidase cbb3-type subunit 2